MCSGFLTPAKRGADVESGLKPGLNRFDLGQLPRVIKAEVKVVQPHCLLLTRIIIAGSKRHDLCPQATLSGVVHRVEIFQF